MRKRHEKDRKDKQDISGNVRKEKEEGRQESAEKRKPEIECAKTRMCRKGACHGGMGHCGSESTTDQHFKRQKADGECGAQPPEQPLRLRERNGEKERVGSESGSESTLHVVLPLAEKYNHSAEHAPI